MERTKFVLPISPIGFIITDKNKKQNKKHYIALRFIIFLHNILVICVFKIIISYSIM